MSVGKKLFGSTRLAHEKEKVTSALPIFFLFSCEAFGYEKLCGGISVMSSNYDLNLLF